MEGKNSLCANCSQEKHVTADEIVKKLLSVDETANFKKSLNELFLEWVQSEVDFIQEERCEMVSRYRYLMYFLDDLEIYEKQIETT